MKTIINEVVVGLPLFDPAAAKQASQKSNVPAKTASAEAGPAQSSGKFPSSIRKWGEVWELDQDRGRAALYRRVSNGKASGWLVLRHRVYTIERRAFGKTYPAGSFRIPSGEDFGRYAWNFTVKGRPFAGEKLRQILDS